MPCFFSIRGVDFDVDSFVAKTGLSHWRKTHKGQPRRSDGEKMAFSIISTSASEADVEDLPTQIADTIQFLEDNQKALSHITTTEGIEEATLDFGIRLRIGKNNIALQSDDFPAELLKPAGNLGIGIDVSLYPIDLVEKMETHTVMSELVTTDPDILAGQPVFRNTRVPIESLFDHLKAGASLQEFLDDFPTLSEEQAVAFLDLAGNTLLTDILSNPPDTPPHPFAP